MAECGQCHADVPLDAESCDACGKRFAPIPPNLMRCSSCGRAVSPRAASCPGCGNPIAAAAPKPKESGLVRAVLWLVLVILLLWVWGAVGGMCFVWSAIEALTRH